MQIKYKIMFVPRSMSDSAMSMDSGSGSNDSYISCVIVAHGGFLTEGNEFDIQPVPIDLSAQDMSCNIFTFAPPGECATHSDVDMNKYIRIVMSMMKKLTDRELDDMLFKHVIQQAYADCFPGWATYRSREWAGYFGKNWNRSENSVIGTKCFDRRYSDCPDMTSWCGVRIGKNNVGIDVGTKYHLSNFSNTRSNGCTLSDIFDSFKSNFDVSKVYISDMACSVFFNPFEDDYIEDPRMLRRLTLEIFNLTVKKGGRQTKKRKTKQKRKAKRKTKARQKTRKAKQKTRRKPKQKIKR